MSQPLKTKNAFLTGGAQGLGKGFVDSLLAAGARVVFGDINATAGAATEREFEGKYGKGRVRFIHFDVTDGPKFEEAFLTAVDYLGFVDLMVNNAGFMNEFMWEKMIQLNYKGLVRGTQLAYEHMRMDKGGRGGRIINVCSEMGLQDIPTIPVYCGTKHAVRGFTSSLAIAPDVKKLGIEYGLLCPGPADTQLVHKMDGSRVRHFNTVSTKDLAKFTASIERINSGFMKLLLLENMNGAILYAQVSSLHFYRMQKFNLGENWPVQKGSSVSPPSTKTPSLKTRNVFLTGGAQGLGKSYVDALLAAGARVVFSDINPKVGAATEKEFADKYGKGNIKFLQFDVTDGPGFERAFQTAIQHLGYIDLMVNNAGFMNETLWEKTIDINFTGVVKGTLLAYEHMRKDKGGKGGRIINISSESGLHEQLLVPVYCGTKQAVRSFTTCLAVAPDAKDVGIEYSVLCPGAAATDMMRKADDVKMRHLHTVRTSREDAKKTIAPVRRIQSGFMKLALLDQMNEAILYATVDEMNFYKVRKVRLGEHWPAQETSTVKSNL